LHILLGVALLIVLAARLPAADDKAPPKDDKAPPKKEEPKKEPPGVGDEYRQFFKKPETTLEFWKAMQFEIEVGRYDLAARHLRGLLDHKPEAKDLLEIADKYGMSAVLRLNNIPKWSDDPKVTEQARKDVKELIAQVSSAVKKQLEDPERIARFVRNLNASPEERDYAMKELYRSGPSAVPYLIEALQPAAGDERENILYALRHMGADAVPPILAALDTNDPVLQVDLVNAVADRMETRQVFDPIQKRVVVEKRTDLYDLRRRPETDPAPYWWPLTASPNPAVRQKAAEALAHLLETAPQSLLPAKVALTREAERYYQHQIKFADPGAVTVWRWDGKRVVAGWPGAVTVSTSRAEEYYGLRYARQALAIDPAYEPAQIVFLSLALEKAMEPGRAGLDKPLAKAAPEINELLATVNPDLVAAVLDRALTDQHLPVILGSLRALGDLADVRASRPTGQGESALVRALYYPDHRIQMAAAETLLKLPRDAAAVPADAAARKRPVTQSPARIVEVLRRAAAAEPVAKAKPKVLIGFLRDDVIEAASRSLEKAGFEPVPAHTGREVMRRLNEAADIDLVMIDADLPDPGLPQLLGQLRSDVNTGLLPVVVLAPPEREPRLHLMTDHYRNVSVAPPGLALDEDGLKRILPVLVREAMGEPLTEAQLKDYAERALVWLGRMARGEVAGYDVRPAGDTVLKAVQSSKLSEPAQLAAIDVVGRLPGTKPQTELANVIIDPNRTLAVRNAAAQELVRHIEQHGPALDVAQVKALEGVMTSKDTDAALRANIALVMGSMRPDAVATGQRLQHFQPAPPAPPVPPEKKEKPEKPPEKK
jgi:CheY-like chemotaxis protein